MGLAAAGGMGHQMVGAGAIGIAPPFILSLSKDEWAAGMGGGALFRGVGVLGVAEAADVGFLVEQLAETG